MEPDGEARPAARDHLRSLNVKRQTVGERIRQEIRDSIIRGDLPPGFSMTETRLSEWLDVSRTPLREAINLLEAEGWVVRLRSGGIEVTTQTVEATYHQFEVRAALEGLITGEVAERITDEDISLIDGWTEVLVTAARGNDAGEVSYFGRKVHQLIHDRSKNRSAVQMLGLLREQIERAKNQAIHLPGRTDEAAKEHQVLAAALASRDRNAAERAMVRHILGSGVRLLQAMDGHDHAKALRRRLDGLGDLPAGTSPAAIPSEEV